MTNDISVLDRRIPKLIFELSSLLLNNMAIEAAMLTCLPQAGDTTSSSLHSIYCPLSVADISQRFKIGGLLEWSENGGLTFLLERWKDSVEKCIVDGVKHQGVAGWDPVVRSLALTQTLVESIYINTGRLPSFGAIVSFSLKYFFHALMGNMETIYKYHSLYLFSHMMDQDPPTPIVLCPGEEPGFIIGGWVERKFKTLRLRLDVEKKSIRYSLDGPKGLSEKDITFITSLMAVKRGCLALSPEAQEAFITKHKINMQGGAYYESNPLYKKGEFSEELFDVQVTVSELTKLVYPKTLQDHIPYWRVPTIRSTFEESRGNGGAHKVFGVGVESTIDSEDQYYCGTIGVDSLNCEPIYSHGFNIETLKQGCLSELSVVENCHAKVHKVNEPFKVRTITAANAKIYHLGRLIQKPLHSFLRRRPEFRLIGESVSAEVIEDVYKGSLICDNLTFEERYSLGKRSRGRRAEELLTCFTFIQAADFSDATDAMHPSLPKIFIETLFLSGKIDDTWRRVLELTLGPHVLHYTDIEILQCWGQLMGSPDSFPVLNVVNASIFWASVNEYYGKFMQWDWIVRTWRCLFNGDDASFLSNPKHMAIWTRRAIAAGMRPSPGKNYSLVNMIQINSQNYSVDYSEPCWADDGARTITGVRDLFILNAGLLHCQAKVISDTRNEGARRRPENVQPVTDQYAELVSACPEDVVERILPVFKRYVEPKLRDNPRSWWLPTSLGGLGLPFRNPKMGGYLITKPQGVFAKALMSDCLLDPIREGTEKAHFVTESNRYLNSLLGKLSVKKIPGRLVRSVATDVLEENNTPVYPSPSLAHCFIGAEVKGDRFCPNKRNWKFRSVADRLVRKGKPSLTNRDCWNLLDGIYKYIPGGLSQPVSVSTLYAPGVYSLDEDIRYLD